MSVDRVQRLVGDLQRALDDGEHNCDVFVMRGGESTLSGIRKTACGPARAIPFLCRSALAGCGVDHRASDGGLPAYWGVPHMVQTP